MNRAVAALLLLPLPLLATSCGNGPQVTSTGGPTAGSLVAVGKMTIGRSLHTATLLPTSEVLLTGGGTPDLPATRSVEIFDPATGLTRRAGDMKVARAEHTATLLADRTVLIVGGLGPAANSAEIYDPASESSTFVGPLTEPRSDHVAVQLDDGHVLILGGDISRHPRLALNSMTRSLVHLHLLGA